MSIVVNLVFDENRQLVVIEDAKSGASIEDLGKWVTMPDGMAALQLRVLGLRSHVEGEDICPTCLRVIPPPPPDLEWRRSKP